MKLTHKLYYCQAKKSTGKPIVVVNVDNGKIRYTNKIEMNNVNIRMAFNNAVGKAKASGATTILEVYKND